MPRSEEKVVIIGAGISGITAANKLIDLGFKKENILILEKEDHVGGKLNTYQESNLVTERGAGVFTGNYPIINWMAKYGIKQEKLLPIKRDTASIQSDMDQLSYAETVKFGLNFFLEQMKVAKSVWDLKSVLQTPNAELPPDFLQNFKKFSEDHGLPYSKQLIEGCLWTGFGYGPIDDDSSYAYRVLEYMGYFTLPSLTFGSILKAGYQAVHGGYQQVVEKMTEGFDVKTSVKIKNINRKNGVKVTYEKDGDERVFESDLLIIATSPYHWRDMNLDLTETEEECVNKLTYYPYPVAICYIKGFPAQQMYIQEAPAGHPAFLNTRDNRSNTEEGRLFTVYINEKPRNTHDQYEAFDKAKIKDQVIEDLRKFAEKKGFKDFSAKVVDIQIWDDYNPTLSWDVGLRLQNEEKQKTYNTIHLTTCLPGNFEIVSSAMLYAEDALGKWFGEQLSPSQKLKNNFNQIYNFFYAVPSVPPVDDTTYKPTITI